MCRWILRMTGIGREALLATVGEGQRRGTKLGPSVILFRPKNAEAKSAGTLFDAD